MRANASTNDVIIREGLQAFRVRSRPAPAIPSAIIEPLWDQFAVLLPEHPNMHPLGCHRPRIRDRLVFDKLVQVLVFGCAYWRIADNTVSATTLRRRRDEWISAGLMDTLLDLVLAAYDRMIGLDLTDLSIYCYITKAPCGGEVAGRSPVDRGKLGLKRSLAVDAVGSLLGTVAAPANRHDSSLLEPTLDALRVTDVAMTVHLDRGYDSGRTRTRTRWRRAAWRARLRGVARPRPSPRGSAGWWNALPSGRTPTRNWSGAPSAAPP